MTKESADDNSKMQIHREIEIISVKRLFIATTVKAIAVAVAILIPPLTLLAWGSGGMTFWQAARLGAALLLPPTIVLIVVWLYYFPKINRIHTRAVDGIRRNRKRREAHRRI
jgi:hypothetical protein